MIFFELQNLFNTYLKKNILKLQCYNIYIRILE